MNEESLILVVEDNDNDAILMQDAFRRAGVQNPIKILVNARQAIDYLAGVGPYADRDLFPMPSIIFTDLNLPLSDGLDLVQWIRGEPERAEIPVIAMTGSGDSKKNDEAVHAGANLAFFKPMEHEKLVEEIRLICEHLLVA
jgi:CheY-like chemotaxis protein